MKKDKVHENDTIPKIALRVGHKDGGEAIWNANADLQRKANGNRFVLSPSWTITIPELKQKQTDKPSGQNNPFKITCKRFNLSITLLDELGNTVPEGWTYVYKQEGWNGDKQPKPTVDGQLTIENINITEANATLLLSDEAVSNQCKAPYEIALVIGGLEPFTADAKQRVRAVQKILTNLGFYKEKLDTSLGPKTKRALQNFKNEYASDQVEADDPNDVKITNSLLNQLQIAQGFPFGMERIPKDTTDAEDESDPGSLIADVTHWLLGIAEPHRFKPVSSIVPKPEHNFPQKVYVAPCLAGEESKLSNHVRMLRPWFVCLDKFMNIDAQLKNLQFRYWLGAKVKDVTVQPDKIERSFSPGYEFHEGIHANTAFPNVKMIDCSGYAKYILLHASETDIGDGTTNQQKWCERQHLKQIDYENEYLLYKNYLLINFIPGDHVWFTYHEQTYESHGPGLYYLNDDTRWSAGVSSRAWNDKKLVNENDEIVSFILPVAQQCGG